MVLALSALVALPTMGFGQWLEHSTPGIPRTSDGKPDLSAPSPRTPDGKPDLSGLWRAGTKFESDLKHSDAQPWAQEQAIRHAANLYADRWAVLCLPPGPMINLTGPLKIVQTPGIMAILYELSNNYRQIFTDGRDLPKDPNPTWQGYSVGRWDGDTLVVETIGFNDKSMIGRPPYPHSEELRVMERYRRRDFGHIDQQMTVDDPKTFLRPWRINAELVFDPDTEMLEFVCNENEQDRHHFVLPQNTRGNEGLNIDAAVLAKYVGTYGIPLRRVTVTLDGDQLTIHSTDGEHALLVPQSATTFVGLRGAIVEFILNERGEVTHLLVEGQIKVPRIVQAR
jgi:hypothetical protein